MLLDGTKRGFPPERLDLRNEPKVKCDRGGCYVYTINENVKVYFEDYYRFLEKTEMTAQKEQDRLIDLIAETAPDRAETLSYYRARKLVVDLVLRTVRGFYGDGANLGVIMSPWCFGTVVLEKVEIYRDQIARGEIDDPNIPEYPYFVLRYVSDIYKSTLLELFGFPEKAFSMRWQYTELLKRYSQVLTNVTASLENVLSLVKKYGSQSKT
jgi:hypothetical protein